MSEDKNDNDNNNEFEDIPGIQIHRVSTPEVDRFLNSIMGFKGASDSQVEAERQFRNALKEKIDLGPMAELNAIAQAELLKKAFSIYIHRHTFRCGQIVKIKTFFDHGVAVRKDQPLVIMSFINPPSVNTDIRRAHTSHFGERLDVRIGIVQSDGRILQFPWDSRELEPHTGIDSSLSNHLYNRETEPQSGLDSSENSHSYGRRKKWLTMVVMKLSKMLNKKMKK